MIKRVKSGLQLHVEAVAREAKQRDKIFNRYKKLNEVIELTGRENALKKIKSFETDEKIINECMKHKKLRKTFSKENIKIGCKVALMQLYLVASNPYSMVAYANTNHDPAARIDEVFKAFDTTMERLFTNFVAGGTWILAGACAYEVIMSLFKKSDKTPISIIIKYIVSYLLLSGLPVILKFARSVFLGI